MAHFLSGLQEFGVPSVQGSRGLRVQGFRAYGCRSSGFRV